MNKMAGTLIRDIQVYADHTSCIQISSGTMVVNSSTMETDSTYEKNAIIPKEPWIYPDKETLDLIISDNLNYPRSKSVKVINLPENILNELKKAGFYQLSQQDMKIIQTDPDFNYFYTPFIQFIEKYLLSDQDIVLTSFVTKSPNLKTGTTRLIDENIRYVGLHLDNWDNRTIDDLDEARNRICINIGTQDRFLLFVNLSVKKIIELLKNEGVSNAIDLYYEQKLLYKFVELFPNYPVIRVRVKPGQAYMAPTENIFHDGSTLGTTDIDIHMMSRGYFSIDEVNKYKIDPEKASWVA